MHALKKNRHLGNIEWEGKDYRWGILTDIPNHVRLDKGDTIVTSGNSFIFPEGLVIGRVKDFKQQSTEKFNKATINFSVDYNNIHHVFVITNLMKKELEQIKNED